VRFSALSLGLVALAVLASVAAACSSDSPTPSDTPAPEFTPLPPDEQRIVYVSDDLAIFTIRLDGTRRQRIIGGGSGSGGGIQARPLQQDAASPSYTWPTWAPDGSQLAVSRSPGPTTGSVASLTLLSPPGINERFVHETGPGLVSLVADGAPHYVQWSPDGQHLAFIAPNREGTALALYETAAAGESEEYDLVLLTQSAPIYFAWSPDSTRLLIHRREELFLQREDGSLENLRRDSFSYRVPAFSRDSGSIAYIADTGRGEHLTVREVATGNENELMPVPFDGAFAWSPTDSGLLAGTRRTDPRGGGYDGLSLFDTRTGESRRVYEGEVGAFYWSPDGTKLAMATTRPRSQLFQWTIVDAESGASSVVATFTPSRTFLAHLQFFDQFAPSHGIWSVDSRYIVSSGRVAVDGVLRRGPNRVWLVDTTGESAPLALAEGSLGFFVPAGAS
jgi:hypothetical protein